MAPCKCEAMHRASLTNTVVAPTCRKDLSTDRPCSAPDRVRTSKLSGELPSFTAERPGTRLSRRGEKPL